ncbi:MAG: type II toxin-antitoxin system HicB family antitoxin [Promethearchaeota archaeon]
MNAPSRGCYSQGKTSENAPENVKDATGSFVENVKSPGEKMPDPSHSIVGIVIIIHDT